MIDAAGSLRMGCCICQGLMRQAFSAVVLDKYPVNYFYCDGCGFLRTEAPYWLEQAYADPITAADTGILSRNVNMAERLTCLLYFGLGERGQSPWLDYAGGLGILTRLMRDYGFNFRWQDKYTQNLFARGFEHSPGNRYRGVVAVEVLEHVPDPRAFLEQVLADTGAEILVFTTVLFSGGPPARDWWYYSFKSGQHISFFQRRTLDALAASLGLHFYSARNVHCFSKRSLGLLPLGLLTGYARLGLKYLALLRLESRTMPDHRMIAGLDE